MLSFMAWLIWCLIFFYLGYKFGNHLKAWWKSEPAFRKWLESLWTSKSQ